MNQDLSELIAALGVAALAAAGLVHALGFPRSSAYLPVAVTGLALTLAIIWAGQSVRHMRRRTRMVDVDPMHLRRLALMVGAALLYVAAVGAVGFFTASALFVVITALVLGMRRLRTILATAACFTLALYLVFVVLLDRPLPPERLFGIIAGASWISSTRS